MQKFPSALAKRILASSHEIKRRLLLRRKAMTKLGSILRNRDITLPTKVHVVSALVFPVVIYGCESWTIKKGECWRIDVFELCCWRGTLESPLDCKEIQPVHPKGDQSWVFIGRTDAEAETPILWPPDVKNWLLGKDPDAGKDWRGEEKGTTEDEMVGWHHWLDGTWVWASSGSWWWAGKPGVLQSMGSKRVGHDWETELNWGRKCGSWKGTPVNRALGTGAPSTDIQVTRLPSELPSCSSAPVPLPAV